MAAFKYLSPNSPSLGAFDLASCHYLLILLPDIFEKIHHDATCILSFCGSSSSINFELAILFAANLWFCGFLSLPAVEYTLHTGWKAWKHIDPCYLGSKMNGFLQRFNFESKSCIWVAPNHYITQVFLSIVSKFIIRVQKGRSVSWQNEPK